jgi:hypothetical protein
MRFFKTSNASRQYRTGGLLVTFEPVENVGGTWSGLLAVEVDSIASQIAAAGFTQITEITEAEYDDLKKKPATPNSSFRDSAPRAPTSSPQLTVADRAAPVPTSTSRKSPTPAKPTATLTTGAIDVPDELATMAPAGKPRRR